MRFRKRPVEVEAVQLLWTTWSEMCEHAGVGRLDEGKPQGITYGDDGEVIYDENRCGPRLGLAIPTLEGLMLASEGDWIIRGIKGELYPCKPDIFEATYEPVATPAPRPEEEP